MTRTKPEMLLKPKLLAVSVAACFALNAAALRANPTGPTVVHGSVGFNGLGTSALTITNQAGGNAIINWNGFSIGVNDLTRFQQFANLAVLNRVTGSEISSILGSLQSDGRVFLINPNGIVFGASARIDTAGLVASSLGFSDQDFLANRLRFTEVPGAGAVVNNGVIETAAGGRVYLVAPTVENNGLIHSPQGAIVLAAGKEVELVDANSPFVTVKVASAESAVNLGTLVTDGGQIGMFGALVANSGVVQAGGAVAGPGGEIRLVATRDLTVGGTVTANGTSGGKVLLQAAGGTNLVSGTVEAKGSSGSGGTVDALGVRVGVVGHGLIDASGDTGGGTVRVGGDYQGANAEVQNAERTLIGADGVIRADAMTTGDGGRVIVWADGDTRFYGSISARGGSESGNGGFVETSGKAALEAAGSVTTQAPNGQGGTWLLDPGNINIVAGNGGPDDTQVSYGGTFGYFAGAFPPGTSAVGTNAIDAGLAANGSVQLQATEDITLQASVNLANSGNLTLNAGNDINLGAHSISMNGSLTLVAADPGAPAGYGGSAAGMITSSAGGGNITTRGGDFSASGASVTLGNINTGDVEFGSSGGGQVTVTANTGAISTGGIVTGGGYVSLTAQGVYGSVDVGGAINTSNVYGYIGDSSNGSVSINATGDVTTSSIVTKSLHPGHWEGGSVFIGTESGRIVVNGTIDTRGANGVDEGYSSYYAGTSGGWVGLSRGANDAFAGTAVSVSGNILTAGGNGVAVADNWFGNQSGGDGGQVEIGDLCDGFCGPLTGNVVVSGVIDTRGGAGGDSGNSAVSAIGGGGGDVQIEASGSVLLGAIDGRGGNAGSGAIQSGTVYYGGDGGQVYIETGTGSTTIGWIDTSGGAGGSGGADSFSDVNGGAGGDGGPVEINSFGGLTIGTVVARGGAGGNGGTADAFYGGTYGAIGGDGGNGGEIDLYSNNSSVSIIAIDAAGGAAGNGGSAYGGTANGGNGGWGGNVNVQSATSTSITASIVTRGGRGGHGGTSSGNRQAEGEVGGDGGDINLQSYYGNVSVASFVDSSGGAGGNGGLANSGGLNGNDASGGDGGEAGYLYFNSSTGSVTLGTILGRGGAGGAGGTATGGDPQSQNFTEAQGGDGGDGYALSVYALNAIATGSIDVSGGRGGAGGTAMDASGGNGGDAAFQVWISSDTSIQSGAILARGGAGGVGGVAQTDQGDSSGGSGGGGGQVYAWAWGVSGGPVTTGSIDASGGNGGNSGSVGTSSSVGGDAGSGGYITYYGGAINVLGPMLARGGNGGNMVNSSILSSLGGTPNGGAAGSGGQIYVWGSGEVQVNVGGAVGGVAMDAGGGTGGSGHPAASPAGNGGAGGSGGFIDVAGTPQMTLFGSLNATGGTGGAGGAGSASVIGGNGGAGGSAGGISLDASSVTGNQIGDGIIFVLAGATPFFDTSIAGGAGGAAGANGGAGGGTAGLAGSSGTFLSGSDYFGTIVILDPLAITEVNQGFQQIVEGNDDTTAFVGGEKEDEEEDKSQKELGSCKG